MDWVAIAVSLGLALLTARYVYGGGTTLNDHVVAAGAVGCLAIYPLLWFGVPHSGLGLLGQAGIRLLLALGAAHVAVLFKILHGRREPPRWQMALAVTSQVVYAFSLWTGFLALFWVPWALWTGAPVLWPGAWLLGPLLLSLRGTWWAWSQRYQVVEHRVRVGDLDEELRVVHLSDLHASPTMNRVELGCVVDRALALRPDLVVVTGDLVMPFSEDEHGFLLDALARFDVPLLACPGNHDLPILRTLRRELDEVGARLLVDQSVILQLRGVSVEVAGVNFHWRQARERLAEALAGLPPRDAQLRLLLAHDPRLFPWLPPGRFDLVLSGHNHGGQVGFEMFGLPGSVMRFFGAFDQGFWQRGATLLYAHRGNWHTGLPPRMGVASEIVLHRLGRVGSIAPRRVSDVPTPAA